MEESKQENSEPKMALVPSEQTSSENKASVKAPTNAFETNLRMQYAHINVD